MLILPWSVEPDKVPAEGMVWAVCPEGLVNTPLAVEEDLDHPLLEEGVVLMKLGAACPAVAMIRGIADLRGGPLTLAIRRGELSLEPEASLELTLGGVTSTLRTRQIGEDGGYEVLLAAGGREAALVSHPKGDDALPHLAWAGDIDRDGRVDLLLDASNHYARTTRRLFLSSFAGRGPVVQVAAGSATAM